MACARRCSGPPTATPASRRADAAALYAPVIVDPVYGYQAVNVEAQERIPGSLLHWMRRILGVRGSYPAFGRGSLRVPAPGEHARARLPAPARGGHHPVRRQPVALRAVRRARPPRFDGMVPLEMIGHGPLPADRRAAVPADLCPPRVLLVPADRWSRSRRLTRLQRPASLDPMAGGQRWYRAKSRPLRAVSSTTRIPLPVRRPPAGAGGVVRRRRGGALPGPRRGSTAIRFASHPMATACGGDRCSR